MDRNRCPACGAARYTGGRCRQCNYEPFTEEIAHGNHYHVGEPLVLKTPPKAVPPGQGCESFSGPRKPWPLKGILAVIAVAVAIGLIFLVPGGIFLAAVGWAVYKKSKKS